MESSQSPSSPLPEEVPDTPDQFTAFEQFSGPEDSIPTSFDEEILKTWGKDVNKSPEGVAERGSKKTLGAWKRDPMWPDDMNASMRAWFERTHKDFFPHLFTVEGEGDKLWNEKNRKGEDASSSRSNEINMNTSQGTTNHFTIVVANLSPAVSDALLFKFFSVFSLAPERGLYGITNLVSRLSLGLFLSEANRKQGQ